MTGAVVFISMAGEQSPVIYFLRSHIDIALYIKPNLKGIGWHNECRYKFDQHALYSH